MTSEIYSGDLIDERTSYSLRELCRLCGTDRELIVEMVEHGIVQPRRSDAEWRFSGVALVRLRRAVRLRRDLGVDLPGLALSLDLLDELEGLRRQVQSLRQQIDRLIEEV